MQQTLEADYLAGIAERHKAVLDAAARQRLRGPLILIGLVAYVIASCWFFSVGPVLSRANWSIAGSYLASWVSFEVRPEFRIGADGAMILDYGRGSPLGRDPHPDWVTLETTQRVKPDAAAPPTPAASPAPAPAGGENFDFMAKTGAAPSAATAAPQAQEMQRVVSHAEIRFNASTAMTVEPHHVLVLHDDEEFAIRMEGGKALPLGPLPSWAAQKRQGEKIILSFGATGWAEVSAERIGVRNRFLGWANFVFDTNSPFFGKPYGEVLRLIASGERLDPARSNLALAWNNICYNAEWQHLDVWTKLLQTIVMAFAGTLFASLVAFPLAFVAARNMTANRILNQVTKRFFDFQRSVDMLIWALFFTRAFGPGPLAGMAAIFFTDTGTLGKLYSEALENIDDKQREGVRSVGASSVAVSRYGVLPQVMPVFASQALYFWESNTRSATIIGAVGAGGIGLKLWEAIRTNSNWGNVAYMVLLLLIVVFIFDTISNALRARLINRSQP